MPAAGADLHGCSGAEAPGPPSQRYSSHCGRRRTSARLVTCRDPHSSALASPGAGHDPHPCGAHEPAGGAARAARGARLAARPHRRAAPESVRACGGSLCRRSRRCSLSADSGKARCLAGSGFRTMGLRFARRPHAMCAPGKVPMAGAAQRDLWLTGHPRMPAACSSSATSC